VLSALWCILEVIRCQLHPHSKSSFYVLRSRKRKKTVTLSIFLCFRDLRVQKLLVECWWNWPQVSWLQKCISIRKTHAKIGCGNVALITYYTADCLFVWFSLKTNVYMWRHTYFCVSSEKDSAFNYSTWSIT